MNICRNKQCYKLYAAHKFYCKKILKNFLKIKSHNPTTTPTIFTFCLFPSSPVFIYFLKNYNHVSLGEENIAWFFYGPGWNISTWTYYGTWAKVLNPLSCPGIAVNSTVKCEEEVSYCKPFSPVLGT